MSLSLAVFYFIFVHLSLLIPGYVLIKNTRLLSKKPALELCTAYLLSIVFFGAIATVGYVLAVSLLALQIVIWLVLIASLLVFVQQQLFKDLVQFAFPLVAFVLMSALSVAFVSLSFSANYTYIPDPDQRAGRDYMVFNVKVLNVAHTNANDNYVPYRQAQFFINRSDPATDSFIDEWGVHFFQRTPLMGAVTAGYFITFADDPPINYLWVDDSIDQDSTYLKFQIIAQVLNAIFILPAFFLLAHFFRRKAAILSVLFLVVSHFFLFNAVFSWPKSLVAFFILFSWLLLIENKLRYTVLAAVASGIAYLAHDLAVLYIAASIIFLLYHKRFRDIIVFGAINAVWALPWLIASSIIYDKPSTFVLYPFSTKGLPPPGQGEAVIDEFFNTPWTEIVSIRIDTLFYLLTPYDLIYSTGGQAFMRRLWAVGLFSVPGSVGLGLAVPAVIGAVQKLRKFPFWVFLLIPIVLAALIIGWRFPRSLGSLHFTQPIIVLLVGLGVAWLLKLKAKFWLLLAFAINVAQLVFFILFAYEFETGDWFSSLGDIAALVVIAGIVGLCTFFVYRVATSGTPAWLRRVSAES